MAKDEHIVKMWTPLKFTTPEDYVYFPRNPLFRGLNLLLRWVIYLIGPVVFRIFFGLRVIGREKIKGLPKKGVVVCNHVHFLDCGVMACHMGRRSICIPTLEENFRMPLLRHLIRVLGGVPLPQRTKTFKQMHLALKAHIDGGQLVQIFPEGVLFPRYNGIRDFKRGAFSLAYDCDVPVIPYVIRYVRAEGWQRYFHRKPVMRLYILDPVYPDTDRKKREETLRLSQVVREKMEAVFEAEG